MHFPFFFDVPACRTLFRGAPKEKSQGEGGAAGGMVLENAMNGGSCDPFDGRVIERGAPKSELHSMCRPAAPLESTSKSDCGQGYAHHSRDRLSIALSRRLAGLTHSCIRRDVVPVADDEASAFGRVHERCCLSPI